MNGAASRTDINAIETAMVAMRTAKTLCATAGDDRIRSRSDRE